MDSGHLFDCIRPACISRPLCFQLQPGRKSMFSAANRQGEVAEIIHLKVRVATTWILKHQGSTKHVFTKQKSGFLKRWSSGFPEHPKKGIML